MDINCDLGEGCDNDAELMKYITSANIACGFHAGDADTMRRTVELAVENDVYIGAHPGYRDRENFGRTDMVLDDSEVRDLLIEQIRTLEEICGEFGATLNHVKPHGALYNQAASDRQLAASIAKTIAEYDDNLCLYGLSGSWLIFEGDDAGLTTFAEAFADRTYQANGKLTPRSSPDALLTDASAVVGQVRDLAENGTVTATNGAIIGMMANTICIHGDGEHAVEFARAIHQALFRTR